MYGRHKWNAHLAAVSMPAQHQAYGATLRLCPDLIHKVWRVAEQNYRFVLLIANCLRNRLLGIGCAHHGIINTSEP